MGAFDDLVPAAQATTAPGNPFSDLLPQQAPEGQHYANGVWDDLVAGYQGSVPGLVDRGKMPDVVLDPVHAKWYDKALAGFSQAANELPETMGAGTVGTYLGGPVAGWAAANAVPTEIRESLVKAYQSGQTNTAGGFLNAVNISIKGLTDADVLKATGKAAAVGALTGGAGRVAEPLGMVGQGAAEAGTLAVSSSVLDGRLPNAEDFANAAVMVVGMKGAGLAASKIAQVYARTGIEPAQVVADAQRDPAIVEQLREPVAEGGSQIPEAYKPAAAAQAAKDIIPDPGTDENHALDLSAMLINPKAAIPESKLPNGENYKYISEPEDVQAVSARADEIFEKQLQEARGSESWAQTRDKALEMIGNDAVERGDTSPLPTDDDVLVKVAAQVAKGRALTQAAAREVDRLSKAMASGGGNTDENTRAFFRAVEQLRMWKAVSVGNKAEVARALNYCKDLDGPKGMADAILEGQGRYSDDPVAYAKYIQGLNGDPQKIARFLEKPATTVEKLQQYYRFSLLTGATVFQVKGIGDMMATMERLANSALRVPSALIGSGEVGARAAEFSAMTGAIGQGIKDGFKGMIDTWKATAEPRSVFGEPGKPNLADKITSFPHRIIESETQLFRVLNERMEMSRQATSIAIKDGFKPGNDDFHQRVTTLLQSPTKEMTEASIAAGQEATFTNKTSGLGKLLQDVSNGKYGAWGGFAVPFAKVPVNIAAWSIKDTPALGLLMEGNREDWAAGGARRDGVIARQVIGGTVAFLAAEAVSKGILTGGGQSMSADQKLARKASGIPDYSFKIGNTWYSYERFQPLGTIAMLASDLMEMHQQADEAYKADLVKMTGAVMGHAIVSQPYFEGIHGFMNAITSPDQSARKFDAFVGSWIPSLLAQAASSADPEKRRVDNLFDAVQQRIPIWRNQLLPQVNPLTGKPEDTERGLGLVSTVKQDANDKVLSEAARIGVSIPYAPKSIELPGKGPKDIRKVELTPEQQNAYTEKSGQFMHQMMEQVVNSPNWDNMPEMVKKQIFSRAIEDAHKWGRMGVLSAEQREEESQRAMQAMMDELGKK